MNKNLIITILSLLLIILAWSVFSPTTTKETSVKKSHFAFGLSTSGDITCTYTQIMNVNYQGDEITHELPKRETNPIIMTFSDIDSEVAKIKFIDATQTISEVPVIKVLDTADKLIFLEGSGDPYMTMHTIYKGTGVSIFAKQISLLCIPIGTISMGTCLDS